MKNKKEKYGDIIYNHDLVKRTMMACAFPCLIKQTFNNDGYYFEGFLPGFEFATITDAESEDECVEYLQDMLDDEVEELVVFGKSLPDVESDEELIKKYPDYKIVYLDINVYALPDECSNDCSHCQGNCSFSEDQQYDDFYDYDCDDDCGCEDDCGCDDDCVCDNDCDCDDDCNCNDNCHCESDCDCSEHKKCSDNCNCKENKK